MHAKTNPVGKGYALWLIPEEPMFSLLAGRISRLSREYSTPSFDPHVTLLSRITVEEREALAKAAALAKSLKPLRVRLGDVAYLDEYFRCLFIRVIPSADILEAHRSAREAFEQPNESPYMPHLSLVYGNLRIEEKKAIAEDLGFLSGRIVEVLHLGLYRVTGRPRDWKRVGKFALK